MRRRADRPVRRVRRAATRLGASAAFCLAVAACATTPPTESRQLPVVRSNAVVSRQTRSLTPHQIARLTDPDPAAAYRLGPTDVIAVNIYLHPDLDVPASSAASTIGGAMVTSDGSVQLPLIGDIHVGGLTLRQAQRAMIRAYRVYLKNPKVAVQLVQARSLRYYLLGAFTQPGVKYPAHPLTLLEALALGGSVDEPTADLYQAYVAQGHAKLPVDLHALLVEGDLSQNIPLASGDTIVIPTSTTETAFVFGSVTKPGAIPFESGQLTLLQALSAAQLDLSSYASARLARIHVIRPRGRDAEFLVIDANAIMTGKAAPFPLEPGDIVFVPPTGVATWNQVLSQLLPSLNTVSALLNPFVQIEYLSRHRP